MVKLPKPVRKSFKEMEKGHRDMARHTAKTTGDLQKAKQKQKKFVDRSKNVAKAYAEEKKMYPGVSRQGKVLRDTDYGS